MFVFFFKQKTAYERRFSDWSSDVCSSDLPAPLALDRAFNREGRGRTRLAQRHHRLVEAHREALDRAVADSWRGHHHLRPAVAKRRERGEHGGEQRQSSEKLHRSDPRSAPSACEATPCARRVQRQVFRKIRKTCLSRPQREQSRDRQSTRLNSR